MNTTTKRTVIRSNAQGTVNRAMLRRLISEGKIEVRCWYRYDDMGGETQGTEWFKAVLGENYSLGNDQKSFVLAAEDFEGGSYARAYIRESGELLFRVHMNLVYQLRVIA